MGGASPQLTEQQGRWKRVRDPAQGRGNGQQRLSKTVGCAELNQGSADRTEVETIITQFCNGMGCGDGGVLVNRAALNFGVPVSC